MRKTKLSIILSCSIVLSSIFITSVKAESEMEKLEVIEIKPVLTENKTLKDDKTILETAEKYLNAVRSLKTEFNQISSDGQTGNGTILLKKPGKMIMTYMKPSNFEFFADGKSFIYIDKELNQVSYMSVDKTPAFFILKGDFSFKDPKIKILSVRDEKDNAQITITQQEDPLAGEVTLIFNKLPEFILDSWRINDAHGNQIIVSLEKPQFNIEIEDSLFKFKDTRLEKYKDRR